MLISVGRLPPYLYPSRRLLRSRDEGRGLITLSKVAPIPGPRLIPMARDHNAIRPWTRVGLAARSVRWRAGRCGRWPRQRRPFPARGQLAVALAQAHLSLPADRLRRGRQLLEPELEMATDLRRVAIGPGPFHQGPPGVGVARLGDAALAAPLPRGGLRGREAQDLISVRTCRHSA